MRPDQLLRGFAVLLALSLTACAVGPDYRAPAIPSSERYGVDPHPGETIATPVLGGDAQRFHAGKEVPNQWWRLFGSERLNALVHEALANSPSAHSAQAALRQAQATARVANAALYPNVDASASITRQKIDTGSFGNPNGGSTIYNLLNANVGVSYSLDLFGGTRRSVEDAVARAELQRFTSEAAYQSLIANVVTAAVQEALLRALIKGQETILADQENALRISETQFEIGVISKADLLGARSALANQKARVPDLRAQLSQVQNQLAVYLGKLPGQSATSNFDLSELTVPADVPVSLPSTLVQRRPDVLAAEAALRSASARIGVAASNRLPRLALSASYGSQASKASDLFTGDVWSLGGNLLAPIFDFGALSAQHESAKAAYAQSEADYKLTVLNAFRDVANALRQAETDAEVLQAQSQAAVAANEALKLTEMQYGAGAASFLQLLTAQQQAVSARTGYAQAIAARLQDTAGLFHALGGGWLSRDEMAGSTNPASGIAAQ